MRFMMGFDTPDELMAAFQAVEDYRNGLLNSSTDVRDSLVFQIEAGLKHAPVNLQKATVIRALLAAKEDEWVTFPSLGAALVKEGVASDDEEGRNKAQAAIRDLSWQLSQKVDKAKLENRDRPIDAFTSRSRAGGVQSYQLTSAGRLAAERYIASLPK